MIDGNTSDGYHTFNGLYYHRMILFSVIVNTNIELAYKVKPVDGWFLVGVNTLAGQYSYHYQECYYHLFDCVELVDAPEFDGHQASDVDRLITLPYTGERGGVKFEI